MLKTKRKVDMSPKRKINVKIPILPTPTTTTTPPSTSTDAAPLTSSQLKMSALLRCIRRQLIRYEVERKKNYTQSNNNKQMKLFEAREPPPNNMKNKFQDPIYLSIWNDIQQDKMKDEIEFGSVAAADAKQDALAWGIEDTFTEKELKALEEQDEQQLKKDFMWSKIELPTKDKVVYAKDALRLFTLASRRVRALKTKQRSTVTSLEMIKVPELTFVALVQDESGHGYKSATSVRKDKVVIIGRT